MRVRSALVLLLSMASVVVSGCAFSRENVGANLNAHAWLMYATGNVAGADVKNDLNYRGISAQPELEGSLEVLHNRLTVDWAHVGRSANGTSNGNFTFLGQQIPSSSNFQSSVSANIVRATYGFALGPELLTVEPEIGLSVAGQDTKVKGVASSNVGALQANSPFSLESNNNLPFPIAGLRVSSFPFDWIGVDGRVSGFGISQGYVIDGQALTSVRYLHTHLDAGFRYVGFEVPNARIRLLGAVLGGGFYF